MQVGATQTTQVYNLVSEPEFSVLGSICSQADACDVCFSTGRLVGWLVGWLDDFSEISYIVPFWGG